MTKEKMQKFLERHNLTKEILAEIADVCIVTLNAYIDNTIPRAKARQRIIRSIYIIEQNNLCMPVIDGYYQLMMDLYPEDFDAVKIKRKHIDNYKQIFNQFYEDEFGE